MTAAASPKHEPAALQAVLTRPELAGFAQDARMMLVSLELCFDAQDLPLIGAESVTDHGNDKGVDLVYIDRQAERAVIAQGYWAGSEKPSAPADKANRLIGGGSWLLSGDLEKAPQALKSAGMNLRQALNDDAIKEIHVWYVHNCPESTNCKTELEQAASSIKSHLKDYFPDSHVDSVTALEIGRGEFQRLYKSASTPIQVNDSFTIEVPGGYEVSGEGWSAFATQVPATWIRELWKKYDTKLLSPNVRDYLGIVRSERNINHGIKKTAQDSAGRFWVYNNGLTILVHSWDTSELHPDSIGLLRMLTVRGLGIINGAQTTGSIGTLTDFEAAKLEQATVMVRFVSCADPGIRADIVKYNNTQNKVQASDFRSTDPVQERLRSEFDRISGCEYRGGRRGGSQDAISRTSNLLADNTVAQSLAAFHGEPDLAYNELRKVWEDDGTYSRFFSDRTSAQHIIFTYSLLKSFERHKSTLGEIPENDRTKSQSEQLKFLSRRGAFALMTTAISKVIEQIVDARIVDPWKLRFSESMDLPTSIEAWETVTKIACTLAPRLADATDAGLRSPAQVERCLTDFDSLFTATAETNRGEFASLTRLLSWT